MVLRSRVLILRVVTTSVWWIAGTFVYYGLSINSTGLSGTMYLNFILTCIVEVPGTLAAAYSMQKTGRKATLISGFFFSAICNILFVFIPGKDTTISLNCNVKIGYVPLMDVHCWI